MYLDESGGRFLLKIVFYITNHGFGHASRNVPLIREIIRRESDSQIAIKSDRLRCDFLRRNLRDIDGKIEYYDDCEEVGLILYEGTMIPDVERMREEILCDFSRWDYYIKREVEFLSEFQPNIVYDDIISWGIKAAKICGIPTVLVSNFIWSQMYKSFFGKEIWGAYEENYSLADKAMWYEIHDSELHSVCNQYEQISMVSREVDWKEVERIKKQHTQPIVFVSLGGSAEIDAMIDVAGLPYDFLTTRGLHLVGDNVTELPLDMINTPDYIAASEMVIAKGGWSTVAEIMLLHKPCALLLRGENLEDNNTKMKLEARGHCIALDGSELENIESIIDRIKAIKPLDYEAYHNDVAYICDVLFEEAKK